MAATGARPAASVRRVRRAQAPSDADASPAAGSGPGGLSGLSSHASAASGGPSLGPASRPPVNPTAVVLGEVRERAPGGGAAAGFGRERVGVVDVAGLARATGGRASTVSKRVSSAPSWSSGGPEGFPVAAHRSVSRFALSRRARAERDQAAGPTGPAVSGSTERGDSPLGSMSAEEIAAARAELERRLPAKTLEFLRKRGLEKAGRAANGSAAEADARGAAESARSRPRGERAEERRGANSEAAPRPASVDAGSDGPSAQGTASTARPAERAERFASTTSDGAGGVTASSSASDASPPAPPAPTACDAPAARSRRVTFGGEGGEASPPLAAALPPAAPAPTPSLEDAPLPSALYPAPAARAAAAAPAEDTASPANPAARVRWLRDGTPAGFAAAAGAEPRATERDPLRADAAAMGWTLVEAAVVTRSTVLAQRLAAIETLASVLAAARAELALCGGDGGEVQVPSAEVGEGEKEGEKGPAESEGGDGGPGESAGSVRDSDGQADAEAGRAKVGVADSPLPLSATLQAEPRPTWLQVYRAAIEDAEVAIVARHALDDASAPVAAAAADLVAELLAPSPLEALTAEALAACPGVGLPLPAPRVLRREPDARWPLSAGADAAGCWRLARAKATRGRGTAAADAEDGEAPPTPEEAARVDPLAGLLATDLGGRLAYLATAEPRAAPAALRALVAALAGGPEAAARLFAVPPAERRAAAERGEAPTPSPLARALAAALDAGAGDALAEAHSAAKPLALRAARLAAEGSASAARQLAGLGAARWAAMGAALGREGAAPVEAADATGEELDGATEALRLWTALVRRGVRVMELDDAFLTLGTLWNLDGLVQAPEEAARGALDTPSPAEDRRRAVRVRRSVEAYLLARAAADAGAASAQCLASLARDAAACLAAEGASAASEAAQRPAANAPNLALAAAAAGFLARATRVLPAGLDALASSEAAAEAAEAQAAAEAEERGVRARASAARASAATRASVARAAAAEASGLVARVLAGPLPREALALWQHASRAGGRRPPPKLLPAAAELVLQLGELARAVVWTSRDGAPEGRAAARTLAALVDGVLRASEHLSRAERGEGGAGPGRQEPCPSSTSPPDVSREPWDAYADAKRAPALRLLAWAAGVAGEGDGVGEAVAAARAARLALRELAPGDERTALRLLEAALSPAALAAALGAARRGAAREAHEGPAAASAATSLGATDALSTAAARRSLLRCCAAAWLGLEASTPDDRGEDCEPASVPWAEAQALADPEASRLPLPASWLVCLDLQAPGVRLAPGALDGTAALALATAAGWAAQDGGATDADLAGAASLALLRTEAVEEARSAAEPSRAAAAVSPLDADSKTSAALALLFAQRASARRAPGLSEPAARALVERWVADASPLEATRGAAVLLALRRCVPLQVQLDALATLREGFGVAMRALPPLERAPPPLEAYVREPGSGVLARAAREAYVELLSDPAAARARRSGAVQAVCGRVAAFVFGAAAAPKTVGEVPREELVRAVLDPGRAPAPAGDADRLALLARLLGRLQTKARVKGSPERALVADLLRAGLRERDAAEVATRAERVHEACARGETLDAGEFVALLATPRPGEE